jgi:predicted ATPase/transcriptional regulator with XRE-family HTH domain
MSAGLRESIKEYLRSSGYSQSELAHALGLHAKVLSRKLNGSGNAHLTHLELRDIIRILAKWHAITTRREALHLLEEAQTGVSLFTEDEWNTSPLSSLISSPADSHVLSSLADRSAQPFQTRQHNLPALTTRLIGRDRMAQRLQQLIRRDDVRLVTLIGTGGSGKTRLALFVASSLISEFKQGVWFVPLAGVSDPTLVPVSILQALNVPSPAGLPPAESLMSYLQNKQLLLVLDNFEQVEEATTTVDALLAAVPGLKVVITSRVALRMYGEHAFSVPPLDIPDPTFSLGPDGLLHYGAVQLFVERAQATMPDFTVTDANAATITQICARVDGLPLALELAAARIRILPPALLLERLEQARLPLLTGGARNMPGRHHTLRNAITWSYNLLSSTEQIWFRRLGIFTGSCSLEAVEAMMQEISEDQEAGVVSPMDMLEQLVDNSLVVQVPLEDGQARFRMLETLREYALEHLSEQNEIEFLRDWHACYYLREAEAAEQGLRGPRQLAWLARMTEDRDNIRSALEWSLQRARDGMQITMRFNGESKSVAGSRILSCKGSGEARLSALELCLRLASALRPYWEWLGYLSEARYWLGAALELLFEEGLGETLLAARAKALSEVARLSSLENNQVRAKAQVEESIALWQRLDDPDGLATALLHRAWVAHATSDYEAAKDACQEGLHHLAQEENRWLRAQLLLYLAAAAGFTGDFEQMQSLYRQSRELFEQLGDVSATADVLKDHGAMMILEEKYTESIHHLLKSIQLCYQLKQKQYLTTGLCWLSIVVGLRGEPDLAQASLYAAQLKGAAEVLMGAIGFSSWAKNHPFIQAVEAYICSRVDERSWEAAWNAGRALTIEQIIDLTQKIGEVALSGEN